MGDQQHRHPVASPERLQHLEDLGLHGHVERGGRLVGHQDLRLRRERDGDHHPLAHATAELMGIGIQP